MFIEGVTGRHTLARGAKGRPFLFSYMSQNPYSKLHATAEQRVAHLRSRGLQIARPNVAARKIEEIGYERLRIYFLSRRDHSQPGKPFRAGTTYNDILSLYDCDARLRDICFKGVGRFELVFRNRLSEVLSENFGSHPYFADAAFKGIQKHNEALQKVLEVFSKSKDQRAKHYRTTYTEPPIPPIWILKEFLTFGTATRLYTALSTSLRTDIASHFGVSSLPVFESWLPCFVDLRNVCAHHDRLFNRRFQKQPQNYHRGAVPTASRATLKAQLECLDFVLNNAGLRSRLVEDVKKVLDLDRYSEVQCAEVGY